MKSSNTIDHFSFEKIMLTPLTEKELSILEGYTKINAKFLNEQYHSGLLSEEHITLCGEAINIITLGDTVNNTNNGYLSNILFNNLIYPLVSIPRYVDGFIGKYSLLTDIKYSDFGICRERMIELNKINENTVRCKIVREYDLVKYIKINFPDDICDLQCKINLIFDPRCEEIKKTCYEMTINIKSEIIIPIYLNLLYHDFCYGTLYFQIQFDNTMPDKVVVKIADIVLNDTDRKTKYDEELLHNCKSRLELLYKMVSNYEKNTIRRKVAKSQIGPFYANNHFVTIE